MPVANRIERFDVAVAANTAQSAAVTTDVSFADGIVQRIELDVPDGHAGFTGIQILAAQGQLVPRTSGAFLVANGRVFGWDLVGVIDTGSFQVKAFNTDIYSHTFHLDFFVLDLAYVPETAGIPPLAPTPLLV